MHFICKNYNKATLYNMKKAILFGLNYPNSRMELHGCVNDVNNLASFLKETKKYDDVRTYTTNEKTTWYSIVHKIYKLAIQTHSEKMDEVCIYYSGHGYSTIDWDGDELDGKDEALIPSDIDRYGLRGLITDDLLKRVLRHFSPNTRVVFICDACHSGSMCDLRYVYKNGRSEIDSETSKCPGNVILLSGCRDEQCSYEYSKVRDNGEREKCGLMTTCLLNAYKNDKYDNVKDLYERVCERVKQVGYPQNPTLSSSQVITNDTKLFM